jgi:ketosteroid isomerase-like protein
MSEPAQSPPAGAEQAVRSTCTEWYGAIERLDFPALRALWDSEFPDFVYQPEEYEEPIRDWEELLQYWEAVPTLVESVPRWREIETDVAVVGRSALVFSRLDTSIRIRDMTRPFDGEVRCSLGLHEADGGWRLIHYHESRLVSVESVLAELSET